MDNYITGVKEIQIDTFYEDSQKTKTIQKEGLNDVN